MRGTAPLKKNSEIMGDAAGEDEQVPHSVEVGPSRVKKRMPSV
jgi:hypothetical protein